MGKWCLHVSSFIFDRISIQCAGNQDRHKCSVEYEFGRNQTTHFGVTCPWVTKITHSKITEASWPILLIVSSSKLQVTREAIESCSSSNSNHICPLNKELPALERQKTCYGHNSAFSFDSFFKLADNEDRVKILHKFCFRPEWTISFRV